MIGLGSNRMSVCRRGGMSVTQAGKGGMEWLTGNGLRERTPYSAAATAALKDAFTAAQWATIRSWGYTADAYLIAAVNQFAVEDPRIMCSLVSGLSIRRYLVGDGNAWIDTQVISTTQTGLCEMYAKQPVTSAFLTFWGMMHSNLVPRLGFNIWSSRIMVAMDDTYTPFSLDADPHLYKVEFNANNTVWYKDSETATYGAFSHSDNTLSHYLFARHNSGGAGNIANVSISYWKIELSDGTNKHLIPCIYNGECGMLDIVNSTFYANQGSGSFTISETPAS